MIGAAVVSVSPFQLDRQIPTLCTPPLASPSLPAASPLPGRVPSASTCQLEAAAAPSCRPAPLVYRAAARRAALSVLAGIWRPRTHRPFAPPLPVWKFRRQWPRPCPPRRVVKPRLAERTTVRNRDIDGIAGRHSRDRRSSVFNVDGIAASRPPVV